MDTLQENNNSQNQPENQIGMSLNNTKTGFVQQFKDRLEKVEKSFELVPFWKYGLNIFTLVTIFFLAVVIFVTLFVYYDDLPSQIPLIYNNSGQYWEIYPKYLLLIMSLVFLTSEIAIFIFSYYIYFFDKRLSIVINILATVVIFIYLLGIAQILSFEII